MSAAKKLETNFYTFEEYLTLEAQAEHKSEYHNGQIYAMAGGTFRHGVIANNFGGVLRDIAKTKKGKCIPINNDVKIYVDSANKAVYPDAAMVCNQPEFKDKNKVALLNPILIIEVLSKGTAAYDRGEKFRIYQQLDSFKEYVLVSQDQPKVECFYREAKDLWRISYAVGLDKAIHLYSLDCEIPLTEIYAFLGFEGGVQTELDL